MRRAPASNEAALWRLLRDRRLGGLKFRRQVPIGRYIADFICMRHRLIIEADGPFHDERRDAERDAWLRAQGFAVLRFPNALVEGRPHEVLATILQTTLGIPSPLAGETHSGESPPDEGSRG
jgi:very-short-patch-repair endonuclease